VGLRTLVFPDGTSRSIAANKKFEYATVIKTPARWDVLHRHYTLRRAEIVQKRINKIVKTAGYKSEIAQFK
jgi:hypothetical protein